MRKYFQRLLGNTDAKNRVGAAIERGRSAHAFLIGGPEGSGKMTFALEIAAAHNCKKRSDLTGSALPCGVCDVCTRIYGGSYTDVKVTEKPKDRATLGVAQIKDLREDMFLSATESEYKVYIIDDAECMTVEAQNALLKVLEEPPTGVVIILLATECDKILTTIKSRVQYVATERFTKEALTGHLIMRSTRAKELASSGAEGRHQLDEIAVSANGVLGEALKLTDGNLSKERLEARGVAEAVLACAIKGGYTEIRSALSQLPTKRAELGDYFELIMCALRDMIATRTSENAKCLYFVSRAECDGASEGATLAMLLTIYDVIKEAYGNLVKNANVQSLINNLAARLVLK